MKLSAVSLSTMYGKRDDQIDDDVAGETGQQVLADDMARRRPESLRSKHVFLVALDQQMRPHAARQRRPADQPEDAWI